MKISSSKPFLNQCLLLDIEINEKNVIYAVGAVFQDHRLHFASGKTISKTQLAEIDALAAGAQYILGHNLLAHDVPRLQDFDPGLQLLKKPAIDTLYLSPLAFPENPYHRLVKDYQLVRDSINDPAQDAELAGKVFSEQWDEFHKQSENGSDAPMLYRSFLRQDSDLAGTSDALGAMGIPLLEGDDLYEAFSWFAKRYACMAAVERMMDLLYDNSIAHSSLAYLCAWLTVAGGNSVLPPWVRHRFPEVSNLLYQLREVDCGLANCEYCQTHHNPRHFLQSFFGFEEFREQPATVDGKSLQEEIVSTGHQNHTLFATLPTGAGKSLCYLLPALMRYQRRNMLTIVISPLQALMKDQVDNFSKQTGTKIAAALYGMLTMPERGEVQDSIRLGDIGVLYVSPEQLRNRSFFQTVQQREIGAWVFDEAHCLSKWGHDFRPDYLYSIRFIREFALKGKTAIPPVQCFTATAKKDVKSEIIDLIQSELGLRVIEFEGGHERTNLQYEVWPVDRYEKNQVILELLKARYHGDGSIVIYCATRKNTEKLADFLQNNGYSVEAFHAGLDPSLKKRIQESFINGSIPIICATNAFGMGIDKEDVRLVIHADIPGSLENYLQEAGRAGRDRRMAECILVFSEHDIEGQFRLSSLSRLTKREIAQILRGLRYAAKGEEEVVLTAGELLRQEIVDIDPDETPDADTRVRTAVAWLERAGFLERNENNTKVFQGKPLVRNLQEAEEKIAGLNLSARQQKRWLAILQALMEKRASQGFSADELAGISAFASTQEDSENETETQRVLKTLNDMAEQGLLTKEMTLTAYVRYKVTNSAEKKLGIICTLERDLLKFLEETAPEASVDDPLHLDLRQVNQRMVDQGHEYSLPDILKLILYGLSRDGKGLAGQRGSVTIKSRGNNQFTLYLHRNWESLAKTVKVRQLAATAALSSIISTILPTESKNASLKVEFTLEQVMESLKNDLMLLPQLKNPLAAAERALTFMHEQGIIDLQQGLAVFRQSMTIRLNTESRGRRYTENDFFPLGTHYSERNFQIHVMNEYARQALDKLGAAMRLVGSYFNDEKEDFIKRYFPGKKKMLERATSEQSYTRIVDDLKNVSQQRIVSSELERNMLVLAGPGAGKTRVVTHRVAFLLRVLRVNPRAILVLCFNRSAVMSLRKRLRELVGEDMNGVTTLTFHGLALRLTGRSLAVAEHLQEGNQIDFSSIITDAIKLLKGDERIALNDSSARESLAGRFSHILVDEYQDIDEEQYELVSLLAGKAEEENDQKLTILAVGDDDQNIYRFRGANVQFIRKFKDDYEADIHYLVENYRSTDHIISAANSLIRNNSDRMKTEHPIQVNKSRSSLPKGGNWEPKDTISRGRVQKFEISTPMVQAQSVLEEIQRLQSIGSSFSIDGCAVLSREWRDLDAVRSVFEEAGVPVSLNWGRKDSFPKLSRIREHSIILEHLKKERLGMVQGSSLFSLLPDKSREDNIWQANIRKLITEWIEETHDAPQPASLVEDYLYEALSDQGRASSLGNGVFLSTVHSVKGLEFDHVFILANNWGEKEGEEMEEDRRLYYVAMSRARETLHLFEYVNKTIHPHTKLIKGDFLHTRKGRQKSSRTFERRNYTLLGMEDLFIDFAGVRKENHSIRTALGKLNVGDKVKAIIRNDHIELMNNDGEPVARLSKKAKSRWVNRLSDLDEGRVVAMVRRYITDIKDEAFRESCFGDVWEVPIVELVTDEKFI